MRLIRVSFIKWEGALRKSNLTRPIHLLLLQYQLSRFILRYGYHLGVAAEVVTRNLASRGYSGLLLAQVMEILQYRLSLRAFSLCLVLSLFIYRITTQAIIHPTVFIELVESLWLSIIVHLDGSPVDIDSLFGHSLELLFLLRVNGVFLEWFLIVKTWLFLL